MSSNPRLLARLKKPGPKRLLALDGGGIRGLISLGYLARIEHLLRQRYRDETLVLSDYFDLIGGTSTGAIIASLLALGHSVEQVKELYFSQGHAAFQPLRSWMGPFGRVLSAKFDEQPLEQLLKTHFGERTLASSDFKTGLMILVRRVDTAAVWALVNLPTHRFYASNHALPLWEVVCASAAAPTYFRPRIFSGIAGEDEALFVDGGVSMHRQPALKLLMVATLRGFGLGWTVGADDLLLCSIGTGIVPQQQDLEALKRRRNNNLHMLPLLLTQLIDDASELSETILQWLSWSPTSVQDLHYRLGTLGWNQLGHEPLFTYLRYDVRLEAAELAELGFDFGTTEIEGIQDMTRVDNAPTLYDIGLRAARRDVQEIHYPPVFDAAAAHILRKQKDGVGRLRFWRHFFPQEKAG
jgi:hypothetical protein